MLTCPPNLPVRRLQATLADFELIRRIGDGSFSHVVLARHRATGQQYALKVIDKQYIQRWVLGGWGYVLGCVLGCAEGCNGQQVASPAPA